jgi:hypothetical protein
MNNGRVVFAGQRAEAFFVDLGAIFDLGDLRPIANLHNTFMIPNLSLSAAPGVNSLASSNVHSIAIQVPITDITAGGFKPTNPALASSSVGIWTTASRQKARVWGQSGWNGTGPFAQLSRLGNPLFNEVLVPLSQKDEWNASPPAYDKNFANGVAHPELAGLLNVLYPGFFTHLAAYSKPRVDLEAILLTGIPAGVIAPTYSTFTGATQADMLRLNLAIAPASTPSPMGILGGDVAGYPNGRRPIDDVVTVELQAIAGITIPYVDKTYDKDAAIADVSDGDTGAGLSLMSNFPYLGTPYSGYAVPA